MERKKLSKVLVYLIFIITVAHFIATKLSWYSLIWWFDMPMHFSGGLFLGFVFLYLSKAYKLSFNFFFKTIAFVFILGVSWEIFELYFVNRVAAYPFDPVDTLSDLFFDLFGGLVSFSYFFKRSMLQLK